MGGGCGLNPVEVSWIDSLFSGGGNGGRPAPVGPVLAEALLLGRMSFRGAVRLVERLRVLEGAGGAHLGVATSELRAGRGIFLGCGGRRAATQRPGAGPQQVMDVHLPNIVGP